MTFSPLILCYHALHMGARLLVNALKRCLKLSRKIGIMAVIVDAKDDAAARFYEQ
jgi:hypothetical protein